MASFIVQDTPRRVEGDVGSVSFAPAVGLEDPRACKDGRALMRFFHERTGGKRLAKRNDFTPSELRHYLTNIMLLDIVYGDAEIPVDMTVRLMGSALVTFFGEYTGKSILTHPSSAAERFMCSTKMAIKCRGFVLGQAEQNKPSLPSYKVDSLSVPFATDGVLINQMFIHIQLYSSVNLIGGPYGGSQGGRYSLQ